MDSLAHEAAAESLRVLMVEGVSAWRKVADHRFAERLTDGAVVSPKGKGCLRSGYPRHTRRHCKKQVSPGVGMGSQTSRRALAARPVIYGGTPANSRGSGAIAEFKAERPVSEVKTDKGRNILRRNGMIVPESAECPVDR